MTHGHRSGNWKSPTYISFDAMRARCERPSHPKYHDYGGRGITVCDRWRGEGGFARFLQDMGERPAGMTLDRIDPDAGYALENCRWATLLTQRWNRRDMLHRPPPWDMAPVIAQAGGLAAGMPF